MSKDIFPKLKILLLEDEEDVRYMMGEILELMEYEVEIACDAEEAIKASRKQYFDYYLIDIVMDGKSGLDALAEMRIKNIEKSVIVISANIDFANRTKATEFGVTKFLPKPIVLADLEQVLVQPELL